MWKLTGARRLDDGNGEFMLVHLDDNGEETKERLLIPVTLADNWTVEETPKMLLDADVSRLLMEMAMSLQCITHNDELNQDLLYTH